MCTCAGIAPGYPQHEPFCGQPEGPECDVCEDILGVTIGCPGCAQATGDDEPECASCNDQGCPECVDEPRVWTRAR